MKTAKHKIREPNWQLLTEKAKRGDVAVIQLHGLDEKYVALVDKKYMSEVRNHRWYVDQMGGCRHARRRFRIRAGSGATFIHRQTLEKFVQALSGKQHNGDIAFRNNETLDCTKENLVLIDGDAKLSLADKELFA